MFNVTGDKSQPPRNITECDNAKKYRYDDYLAIPAFKLSYVVEVDAWLGEGGKIFGWRWSRNTSCSNVHFVWDRKYWSL